MVFFGRLLLLLLLFVLMLVVVMLWFVEFCVILVVLVVGCVCVEMWVWFGVVDMVLLVQPVIGVCGGGVSCMFVCLFVVVVDVSVYLRSHCLIYKLIISSISIHVIYSNLLQSCMKPGFSKHLLLYLLTARSSFLLGVFGSLVIQLVG